MSPLPELLNAIRFTGMPRLAQNFGGFPDKNWWRVHASAIAFGACVLATGAFLLYRQWQESQKLATEEHSPRELEYLTNRNRRRTQVAGMVLLIGIMVLVGDCLIPWGRAPLTFALYWMITLLMAVWTGFLGLGDMAATRVYMNSELKELRRKMEIEILEHRSSQTAGGRDRD